jgi:uracil-DNA glycosylase
MARSSISSRKPDEVRARQLQHLLDEIRACRICRDTPSGAALPHEPRPVVQSSTTARILIAGQAPGTRVHATGLPFADPSGDRLRMWMGVDRETFYDASRIAIVPMGFCFPGLDQHKADLPPRPECRKHWHDRLMAAMPQIETILVIGNYARKYHFARAGLDRQRKLSLPEAVRSLDDYAQLKPRIFLLPHPSWRNSGWLKKHFWFEAEILPALREEIARLV